MANVPSASRMADLGGALQGRPLPQQEAQVLGGFGFPLHRRGGVQQRGQLH